MLVGSRFPALIALAWPPPFPPPGFREPRAVGGIGAQTPIKPRLGEVSSMAGAYAA